MRYEKPYTRAFVFIGLLLVLGGIEGCSSREWRKWYIPIDNHVRKEKDAEQVAFLESEPKDRKFVVLGIIAPPDDKFDSFGETVNAIRGAAGLFGADAVFLISEDEGEKWGFHASGSLYGSGASGGKSTTHKIRAKAIAWVQ